MYEPSTSDFRLWAFTVRKNVKASEREAMTEDDYSFYLNRLRELGAELMHHIFERDDRGRLHIHGILQLPKKFYRKDLHLPGFSYKLCNIFDLNGWLDYMYKHHKPEKRITYDSDDDFIIPNHNMFKRN